MTVSAAISSIEAADDNYPSTYIRYISMPALYHPIESLLEQRSHQPAHSAVNTPPGPACTYSYSLPVPVPAHPLSSSLLSSSQYY